MQPYSAIPGPWREFEWSAIARQIALDRDPLGFMQRIRRQYGNLVRYQGLFVNDVFAFGPEHNRELHSNTEAFSSRPFLLKGVHDTAQTRLRKSIFQMSGVEHRIWRHSLLGPFQKGRLAGYHRSIVDLTRQALAPWKAGEQRDLHRDMHLLVWTIVRQLLYGMDQSQASDALHDRLEHWMFQTFSPWVRTFQIDLPYTPFRRMLREAEALEAQFLEIMEARRAAGARGDDALSALLRIELPLGNRLSLQELVGHALTLFLVAYETTGNTLTWTLFLLAQHPEIQQDLLDELAPCHGQAPSADFLNQLPLLDRVLKESMRLLPAVPYSRRQTSCPTSLGSYELPEGVRVIFSHYITHHLPELYAEPERFLPERWETIDPTPAEYLPFGAGLRTCLGVSLAPFIIKIALALILPKWKLKVVPNTAVNRQLGISLGPKNGLPVLLAAQDRQLTASPIRGNIHEMVDFRPREAATRHHLRAA